MALQLAKLPKLIVERRSSALFGVVIIAMLWGGISLKYVQDVRGDQRDAERTNQNFAMVFEENVLRSIGEIDKALLYMRRSIETRQSTVDYHTIVNTADVLSEIIVQVAIIDAKGIMRASNAGPQPAPPMDLSDREHFRVHLKSGADRLFISTPVVGRVSRQWSVQFTRRFLNRDGSFGGVVVASLNPAHLTDFYNKIDFGSSTSIALVGADGVVRSSGGGSGGFALGQDLSKTTMVRHAFETGNLTFDDVDPTTGETRLVTFRQVRGHPLWVSVSRDKAEIYQSSWTDFQWNALAGVILTLIMLAAMERILASEARQREAETSIARLATEDPLTGLPNRRVFRATLDDLCGHHAAAGSGHDQANFAVMFLDVDRFKVVNDTLGHRIGDMLLQEVAARLKTTLPQSHILARLGGDEFAVVVPTFNSRWELEAFAECMVNSIVQLYEIDGYQIRSSVSIGIAVGLQDGKDVDELLMAADLALYAVKAEGRGSYRFYHRCMNADLHHRREIEVDLRAAIERNELELHYQPIINLKENVVTGFEALARWRHPVKGMISPASFIPIAEDSGLILPIGKWAMREACLQAAKWPANLKIAVNLSPAQLLAPDLLETVEQILAETGLPAHRLEIEITERIIMEDTEFTLSCLQRLKAIGVRIAMDDFGTGYSSLSYLRRFAFDKIKVDRTFVSDVAAGPEHAVIVQAVVSIARALGMTTTAEGVEVEYQQEYLTALGYDEAQGFLFSPAVPADEVPALIERWSPGKAAVAKHAAA
jgi:diguanylate cyclase (GGDEF)-like protein